MTLLARIEAQLADVNLERARLARIYHALREARYRLTTGADPVIIETELRQNPSGPLGPISGIDDPRKSPTWPRYFPFDERSQGENL